MKTFEILDQFEAQMDSLCKDSGAMGYAAKCIKTCREASQVEEDPQTRTYLKQSNKNWGLFVRDFKEILEKSREMIQKFEDQENNNKKEGNYEQRNPRSIENSWYGYYIATRNRILRLCRQWWPSA